MLNNYKRLIRVNTCIKIKFICSKFNKYYNTNKFFNIYTIYLISIISLVINQDFYNNLLIKLIYFSIT